MGHWDTDSDVRREALRRKLVATRKREGLTQQQVAKMLDCTQSRFSKLERSGLIDFVEFERLAAIQNNGARNTLPYPILEVHGVSGVVNRRIRIVVVHGLAG